MSVKVRPYKQRSGAIRWEVDIRFRTPKGNNLRKRERPQMTSKSAALKWGEQRERELILNGPPTAKKEVPTIEEFAV